MYIHVFILHTMYVTTPVCVILSYNTALHLFLICKCVYNKLIYIGTLSLQFFKTCSVLFEWFKIYLLALQRCVHSVSRLRRFASCWWALWPVPSNGRALSWIRSILFPKHFSSKLDICSYMYNYVSCCTSVCILDLERREERARSRGTRGVVFQWASTKTGRRSD